MYQHTGLKTELLLTQSESFQCSRSESRRRLWLAAWSLNVCVLDPDFLLSGSGRGGGGAGGCVGGCVELESIPKNLIYDQWPVFCHPLNLRKAARKCDLGLLAALFGWGGTKGSQGAPESAASSSSWAMDKLPCCGAAPVSASYSFLGFEGYVPGLSCISPTPPLFGRGKNNKQKGDPRRSSAPSFPAS